MAPADDELARLLAPLLLGGQSPEVAERGSMVRENLGMEGAQLSQQKSAPEPTLAPGEWDQMSRQQAQVRTLGQLGNILLSSPGITETLPGIQPHGPELRAPGARPRSASEEAGIARALQSAGPSMGADYRDTVLQAANAVREWKPGPLPGTEVGGLGDSRVVRSGDSYAVIDARGVVTDLSGARPGSPSAGRVMLALKQLGATPPRADAISPDATKVMANPALTRAVRERFTVAPPFYSQAKRVLSDPNVQETQTGEAWQRFLTDPKRGVKAEEMKYTGLAEMLASKFGQRVGKGEIAKHLDENAIEVKEVTKGYQSAKVDRAKARLDALEAERQAIDSLDTWERTPEQRRRIGEIDDEAERLGGMVVEHEGKPGATKFSQYNLPGAENYREVLLTLPRYQGRFKKVSERLQEITEYPAKYHAEHPELRDEFDALVAEQGKLQPRQAFKSGHWDEEDVIAHLRLSDRTVGDKRTLLVEEIQSDWAQKGRKQGFVDPAEQAKTLASLRPQEAEARKAFDDAHAAFLKVDEAYGAARRIAGQEAVRPWSISSFSEALKIPEAREAWNVAISKPNFDEHRVRVAAADDIRQQASENLRTITDQIDAIEHPSKYTASVPTAPFVTDTSKWTTLALKRLLKMAADEGYDAIGIVPGAEQAKRYDLSQHIDTLTVTPLITQHGLTYEVKGSKTGEPLLNQTVSPDKLSDTIGKELADRVVRESEGKRPVQYEGLDLQVGGEGMKGYYDKIVPETLNKLAKEYGGRVQIEGGKVDTSGIADVKYIYSGPEFTVDTLPSVKDFSASTNMQLNEVRRQMREGMSFREAVQRYGSEALAKDLGGEIKIERVPVHTPIHIFDVPEPMRKQIKRKGFPLYSKVTAPSDEHMA